MQFQALAFNSRYDLKESESNMTKTIVAIYDDIAVARQVVEDLVKADFARSTISLVTNDANNQYSRYLDKDYVPKEDAVTASEGAGFGAVVGGLTGVLVGLAALMIPGIGLAIVAGPIVAGLTGVVAGALTGGVVGALVKSGVPEDEAPYYAEGIRRGGTLVSLQTSDVLRAEDIMHRQGSVNIHERVNVWREDGWKGFDNESIENDVTAKSLPVVVAVPATNLPIARETHPITIVPVVPLVVPVVEAAPVMDDDDTVDALPIPQVVPPVMVVTETSDTPLPPLKPEEPILVVVDKQPQTE